MAIKTILRFNGDDGSTVIVDDGAEPLSWFVDGNGHLETSDKKWGVSSYETDSGGDTVHTSTGESHPLSTTLGWSVDLWVKMTADLLGGFFEWRDNGAVGRMKLGWLGTTTKTLYFSASSDGATFDIANSVVGSAVLTTGNWYHLAVVRDKTLNKYFVFVMGEIDIEVSSALEITTAAKDIYIGSDASLLPLNGYIQGFFDEFRWAEPPLFPDGEEFDPPEGEEAFFSGSDTLSISLTEDDEMMNLVTTSDTLSVELEEVAEVVDDAGSWSAPALCSVGTEWVRSTSDGRSWE